MRSVLLAVALAVVPAPARAEASPPERKLQLALKVARVVPLKDKDLNGFDGGFSLEAALRWRLGRHVGVELESGRLSLDRSQTGLVGGLPAATAFLKAVRIFACAESLGGVESLIEHPAIMTHASVPKATREQLGIADGFIRVSAGIEHVDDLVADLERGFAAARKA